MQGETGLSAGAGTGDVWSQRPIAAHAGTGADTRTGPTGTLVVVGPGLLGGSFALAARSHGFSGRVLGVARRAATRAAAVAAGVVDEATDDLRGALAQADLVVLATPVSTFGSIFREAAAVLPDSSTLIDLGSTKHSVVLAAERELGHRLPMLVPCHPMAGGTATGPAAARADLFRGCVTAVTPVPQTDPARLGWVTTVWSVLGASVLQMTPTDHDHQAAVVSHLPHVLAVCCREVAREGGAESALAASGYAGVTRLADGDPQMRAAILRENQAAVLAAIDRFADKLAAARARVAAGDPAALVAWLEAVRGGATDAASDGPEAA